MQTFPDGPVISVVIPTYRRAHILGAAIESALAQTYRNFEVLIVDDGSPDDTESVARRFTDQDARVRYVRHVANRGLPAARNTGIHAARGRYIAFLDDDDRWDPRKLERQLHTIKSLDAMLCIAVANGRPLRRLRGSRVTLDDLRRGSFDPSSLLAKTEVLRDVLFDEALREGEDWDAFIRIGQKYAIGWLPEPLLLYNDGDHTRMTSEAKMVSPLELERRTTMLTKHREFFGEWWYRYHLAAALMPYISSRPHKLRHVVHATKRCGVWAVVAVFATKTLRYMRWFVFHRVRFTSDHTVPV